jgi:hypothetical protein
MIPFWGKPGDTLFCATILLVRAPDDLMTMLEIIEILEKAQALDLDMEAGSDLEKMTLRELESLVNNRQ